MGQNSASSTRALYCFWRPLHPLPEEAARLRTPAGRGLRSPLPQEAGHL